MKDKLLVVLTITTLLLSSYLIYDASTGLSNVEVKTELNNLRSDYKTLQKDLEVSLEHVAVSNSVIADPQQIQTSVLR